jgi:hypothetical protein
MTVGEERRVRLDDATTNHDNVNDCVISSRRRQNFKPHKESTAMTTADGSARDFVDHWDWAASKGLMPKATAGALRIAASRILQIEGETWESVDVRELDVESLLGRFENLAKKEFAPGSLSTYQSRFRKALQLYLSYLKDPSAYRPPTRGVRRSTADGRRAAPRAAAEAGPDVERDLPGYTDMVKYPFPIRNGVIAQLSLPVDLQKGEAKRLAAFLDSLAVETAPLRLPAHAVESS